jgi:TetR/AcrR family transcriptional regulator
MSPELLPDGGPSGNGNDGWELPRGAHKLPREVVVGHQRQRLLSGVAEALTEHGYADLSVAHVLEQAGVSRTTFYDNFDNKRECVLVAHEEAFDRLAAQLFRACAGESGWPSKVAAAIAAAIDFALGAPAVARLLVLDALAAEPFLASRVLVSNDFLVGLLRNGREQCSRAAALPELTERALIGATTSIIGAHLMADQADRLPGLEPQIVQLILMPYVGLEEAARVAGARSSR